MRPAATKPRFCATVVPIRHITKEASRQEHTVSDLKTNHLVQPRLKRLTYVDIAQMKLTAIPVGHPAAMAVVTALRGLWAFKVNAMRGRLQRQAGAVEGGRVAQRRPPRRRPQRLGGHVDRALVWHAHRTARVLAGGLELAPVSGTGRAASVRPRGVEMRGGNGGSGGGQQGRRGGNGVGNAHEDLRGGNCGTRSVSEGEEAGGRRTEGPSEREDVLWSGVCLEGGVVRWAAAGRPEEWSRHRLYRRRQPGAAPVGDVAALSTVIPSGVPATQQGSPLSPGVRKTMR